MESEPTRQPASAAATPGARIPPLDGLRGIAIVLVMMFHFAATGASLFESAPSALDRAVLRVTAAGWVGVDLFFVLSGFLITGILYDARRRDGYFRGFYARRVLRIFPLYYVFLFALFVVVPLLPHTGFTAPLTDQVWYWLYLPNLRAAVDSHVHENLFHGATSHLWSLSVEEQFYLLWPIVVLAVPRRALMRTCIACIVCALAFRAGVRIAGINPETAYRLMPARMDALAAGGLAALMLRSPIDVARIRRYCAPVAAGAGIAVAALFASRGGLHPHDVAVQTVGYTALAACFAALVLAAALARPRSLPYTMLTGTPLTALGRYSYGLYIVHVPIVLLLAWRVGDAGAPPLVAGSELPAIVLFSAGATAASLAGAWLTWRLIEMPFLSLKSRYAAVSTTASKPLAAESHVAA